MNTDVYVHRSGRTGRAGRTGVSLLIFNRYEKRELLNIESELGHAFRFEVIHPPSGAELMSLAIDGTLQKMNAVPADTVEQFKEAAQSLLDQSSNPVELVARCLATMNNRPAVRVNRVQSRPKEVFPSRGGPRHPRVSHGGPQRHMRNSNYSNSYNRGGSAFGRYYSGGSAPL